MRTMSFWKRRSNKSPTPAPPRQIDINIDRLLREAMDKHRAGQLETAEALYRQILAIDANHPDSLHLLGVAAYQRGKLENAADLIGKAIGVRETSAAYYANLGNVLRDQGKLAEAIAALRRAIDLKADSADAFNNLGNMLQQDGQIGEAVSAYRKAMEIQPDHPLAGGNLGIVLTVQERWNEAVTVYRDIVARMPSDAQAHNNLGSALLRVGSIDAAIGAFRQAVALQHDYALAHSNLGNALCDSGSHEDAIASCRNAVSLEPANVLFLTNLGTALETAEQADGALDAYSRAIATSRNDAQAHDNLAILLNKQGRIDDAIAEYKISATLRPINTDIYSELGGLLHKKDRYGDAIDCYHRALSIDPGRTDTLNNLGVSLQAQGFWWDGMRCYERAVQLAPEDHLSNWNHALALLAVGDYELGWKKYGRRFFKGHPEHDDHGLAGPEWHGGDLQGETVLLYGEQGLGDQIQFLRYATLIADRGGRVVLDVAAPLKTIAKTIPGVSNVVSWEDPLPAYDYHLAMMAAPVVFGTTLDTIPATVPYLTCDGGATAKWQDRLQALPGLKVGVVWGGNPRPHDVRANIMDRHRSISLRSMEPVLRTPGITFISLQKGAPEEQLNHIPPAFRPHNWMNEINDFSETAALISALDLVISVDTSVAHLAGALGKAIWILSRLAGCWRWLLEREDSPWYPTARIFRQKQSGDWDEPLEEIKMCLLSKVTQSK